MLSLCTSPSRPATCLSRRAVTVSSPRAQTLFSACMAPACTELSWSSSSSATALATCALPLPTSWGSESRAPQRIRASLEVFPASARAASIACGSSRAHRCRNAVRAAYEASSSLSWRPWLAMAMPWAPPCASMSPTISITAQRTSASLWRDASSRSPRNLGHPPRGTQILRRTPSPEARTAGSASSSASRATFMLMRSPCTPSACSASAACRRRSSLAPGSSRTCLMVMIVASSPRSPTSRRLLIARARTSPSPSEAHTPLSSSSTWRSPGQAAGNAGTSFRRVSTAARRTAADCPAPPFAFFSSSCPRRAAMEAILFVWPFRAARLRASSSASSDSPAFRGFPLVRSSMSSSFASVEPPPCAGLARSSSAIWMETCSSTSARQSGQNGELWSAEARHRMWNLWPHRGSVKVAARSRGLRHTAHSSPVASAARVTLTSLALALAPASDGRSLNWR
mmetsp:Transcript_20624/g.57792  ORF Transcript_20624/g.57792 Transcript_20624/m.57792 type:complete len:456 (-) Transcript_20624:109-1476(-)